MKTPFVIIIVLLITMCLFSCGDNLDSRLTNIETKVNENPDSMFEILTAIKPAELKSERSKAEFGVFRAMARHKCHIFVTEDSLIDVSVDYYRKKGVRDRLMKSLFYKGVVKNTGEEYRDAMFAAEEAKELAEAENDYYWMAKCYELIADIFHSTYNNVDQLPMRLKAAHYYKMAGKDLNNLFALLDYAGALGDMGHYNLSMELLDSLISLDETDRSPALKGCCYTSKYYSLIKDKHFSEAELVVDSMIKYYPYPKLHSQDLVGLATLEFNRGNEEKMLDYLNTAMERSEDNSDLLNIYWLYLHYYERKGDLKKAMEMEDSVLAVNNRQIRIAISQSGVTAQRDFSEINRLEEVIRSQRMKFSIIVLSLVALAVIAGMIAYHRSRIMEKNNAVAMAVNELKQLSGMFDEQLEKERMIMDKVGALLKTQLLPIENIAQSYTNKVGSGVEKSIIKDIESEFNRLGTEESYEFIVECVDSVKDGLASRFAGECEGILSVDEIKAAIYLMAGFSPRVVSLILNIKLKTFYAKRSRILAKLQESPIKDKSLFINELL